MRVISLILSLSLLIFLFSCSPKTEQYPSYSLDKNDTSTLKMGHFSNFSRGQILFKVCCASCHKVTKDMFGPALKGATEKFDWEWLLAFTRNSRKMINDRDSLAVELYNQWGTMMRAYPSLTDDDIISIYNFIDLGRELPADTSYIIDTFPRFTNNKLIPPSKPMSISELSDEELLFFSLVLGPRGWNIFEMDKNYAGECLSFQVRLSGDNHSINTVCLAMPNRQILIQGIPTENDTYTFGPCDEENQMSFVSKGERYWLIAISMKGEKIYLGAEVCLPKANTIKSLKLEEITISDLRKSLESIF